MRGHSRYVIRCSDCNADEKVVRTQDDEYAVIHPAGGCKPHGDVSYIPQRVGRQYWPGLQKSRESVSEDE